jgi:arsenic resistance protein ArsH
VLSDLPNILPAAFEIPDFSQLATPALNHKPRILMLYGSLRERSYSRLLTFEGQRLLEAFGAEVRIYHADGLPLPNDAPDTHPKVQELREAMVWSEGQVWTSPERHGP